jgi:hypothetical protein
MRGGYGPGAGPVGYSWDGGKPMTWPGVIAANGGDTQGAAMSNFYKLSPNGIAVGGVDIAVPEVGQFGGRKRRTMRRKGKHSRKGGKRMTHRRKPKASHRRMRRSYKGGFGPQELINFGRDLKYKLQGAVSSYMGDQQPVNPSPLVQPIGQNYKIIEPTPTNLPRSYTLAGSSVAPL